MDYLHPVQILNNFSYDKIMYALCMLSQNDTSGQINSCKHLFLGSAIVNSGLEDEQYLQKYSSNRMVITFCIFKSLSFRACLAEKSYHSNISWPPLYAKVKANL